MKQETKEEKREKHFFPMSVSGCHYATGPPLFSDEMSICK